MAVKYQVILLGTLYREEELYSIFSEESKIVFIDKNKVDKFSPRLYLYMGRDSCAKLTPEEELELMEYANTNIILPIVPSQDKFKENIPKELHAINAHILEIGDELSLMTLKNQILSYFFLCKPQKKIFISYKRTDSAPLANMLYQTLVERNYIPFLDIHSIESGQNFQQQLRQDLEDSDIILLLNSKSIGDSQFVQEECNIADEEDVPLVVLQFNDGNKGAWKDTALVHAINVDSEQDSYDQDIVNEVVDFIENIISDTYISKRQSIIRDFKIQCLDYNLEIIEEGGFLRCDDTFSCFYPLPKIPDALDLYDALLYFSKTPLFFKYEKIVLYRGKQCSEEKKKFIKWLDQYLPIKSFNILNNIYHF